MNLREKIALVTGASRNTGWAIARSLAAEGATVYIHDLHSAEVDARATELNAICPFSSHFSVTADLRVESEVAAMFEQVRQRHGRLDLLVGNAVHQGLSAGTFSETSIGFFDDVWSVNVRGHILCAQNAISLMPTGGSLVFIGSNTATRAIRGRAAYIASKGAIGALTRALALDLAPLGIRVNEIAPGYIHTERWESLNPAIATRRRANLPLGREVMGEDIGAMVVYLASEAAAAITGASFPISGGMEAQLVPLDCEI